ncbi:MAG: hypothetical protein ABFR89_06435 [Actinomycetota bacterium]
MYRHTFDTVSFIFGVLFLALAGLAATEIDLPDDFGVWIVPGAVLLLGVGLAVSAIASTSSKEQ